jgi:hypothetical protein
VSLRGKAGGICLLGRDGNGGLARGLDPSVKARGLATADLAPAGGGGGGGFFFAGATPLVPLVPFALPLLLKFFCLFRAAILSARVLNCGSASVSAILWLWCVKGAGERMVYMQ